MSGQVNFYGGLGQIKLEKEQYKSLKVSALKFAKLSRAHVHLNAATSTGTLLSSTGHHAGCRTTGTV